MRIKIVIIKLILSLILLSGNAIAKNLPPGSGISDVPANVLILLDKSGSMGARMTSGAGIYYPYSVAVDTNGDVYAGQYYTYGIKKFTYGSKAVDTSFAQNGTYRGSGNCRSYYPFDMEVHNGYLYVAAYYQHRVFRINLSTGKCDWNKRIRYARNVTVSSNNILYAFGVYGDRAVRNVSTNTDISCSTPTYARYSSGTTVDASSSNFYVHYYRNLYRYTINSNGCINTSVASRIYRSQWRYGFGLDAHPSDDSILYGVSYYEHGVYKVTLNTAKNGATFTKRGRCCRGTSSGSNTYFYYPYGLSVDTTNNRVLVANYSGSSVHALDLDLTYIKTFGGSSGTRMSGAHEAIKAIVTDSSLTAGVNFGFGYWSWGGSPGFRSWSGNITTGNANPCTRNACIKVRAHKAGAARINQIVTSVSPGGGTNADDWAKQAQEYYLHSSLSPIDKNLNCQNSYVLVIGDGDWWGHGSAQRRVTKLLNQHKIKTFTVAYGGGLSNSGVRNFDRMAQAGGTNNVIVANTTASLKSQLKAAISQIIASKLSFTAPAITATIEQDGSLFQAQFDYEQNQEWRGTLTRTAIDKNGNLNTKDTGNWSAKEELKKINPDKRKIWSEIPGTSYKSGYNNFTDSNWQEINTLFQVTNNTVSDYHSVSADPSNTRRCASTSGVANGTDDDVKGLINFIRGKDYFDYDGDCNLTESRPHPLGDIYHSEMVVIGSKPKADTAFVSTNQEAYYRSIKGYDGWASGITRDEIIYVGANDGMLHAFNAKNGKEEWAFVPPFIAASMPNMINVNLNRTGVGGSNAIYGVDGSVTAHDMYFQSAYDTSKKWHTILLVPYGRGGAGFSVLDVTDPKKPLHLYSILNDHVKHKVHVMDHNGSLSNYDYVATSYPISTLVEAVVVTDNAQEPKGDEKCTNTTDHQCFQSKKWTLPASLQGVSASDLTVVYNDKNYSGFSIGTHTSGTYSGQNYISFNTTMKYYGYDPANNTDTSSNLGIYLKPGSKLTGVQTQPEYDYSALGETWSSPRIIRLPNNGAGDTNIEDDIYVAIMGGGFGAQHSGFGSNLTLVNLEDTTYPGRIHKVIPIEDMISSDIVNSVPGSPVVITSDTARGLNFRGALVYLSDLEGKITKFNLTNMSNDGSGNAIALYDSTTLFTAGSNTTNGRYMFHSMDATIGQTTNSLWLYAGTGDYHRIADSSAGVQNLMLGIHDSAYPFYKEVRTPSRAYDLTKCKNTTNDSNGAKCPKTPKDKGWYITLPNKQKVTAEPTVNNGLVYFPIYQPSSSVNKCSLGDAFICAADDECGTNFSKRLGKKRASSDQCFYVGQGVLSRIVFFANKLFANIAGQSTQNKKDLVVLDAAAGEVTTYRSSWRNNF